MHVKWCRVERGDYNEKRNMFFFCLSHMSFGFNGTAKMYTASNKCQKCKLFFKSRGKWRDPYIEKCTIQTWLSSGHMLHVSKKYLNLFIPTIRVVLRIKLQNQSATRSLPAQGHKRCKLLPAKMAFLLL